MSRVKWSFEQRRVALFKTPYGTLHVGDIEEYKDHEGIITVVLRLRNDLDEDVRHLCDTEPEKLTITSMVSAPRNVLILPTIEIPPG